MACFVGFGKLVSFEEHRSYNAGSRTLSDLTAAPPSMDLLLPPYGSWERCYT